MTTRQTQPDRSEGHVHVNVHIPETAKPRKNNPAAKESSPIDRRQKTSDDIDNDKLVVFMNRFMK
jgi:hypothetical protein